MSEFSIRTKTFRLGLADYRALWLCETGHIFTSPLVLLGLGAWFGLPLLRRLETPRDSNYPVYLCAQLALLAFCLAVSLAVMAFRWWRDRRDPMRRGDRIMVLDAAAIRVIGYGYDVRQNWVAANRVRQGRHHVYIHMNSGQVYPLPKRALSLGDAERLTATLNAAIRGAHKAPAALVPLAEAPDNRELWRCRPYRLTLAILLARLAGEQRASILFLLGGALVGAVVDVWLQGIDSLDTLALIYAAAVVLVCFLLGLLFGVQILRRRKGSGVTRDMGFTRDYIRCTTAAFDIRVDWANIRSVHRIGVIFTFRFSTGRFDVPASAFATRAEAMAFFTQAVAFWRAAEARR